MLNYQRFSLLQRGATLVELMISLAIGSVSVLTVASLVGMGIGVNSKLLTNTRLKEELKGVVTLIERDIRRAGYYGSTITMLQDPDDNASPFANSISIAAYLGEPDNSCILFAYDANDNGALDVVSSNENYGYRLKSNAIEIRKNGISCEEDGWEDLTDPEMIKVTSLAFTESTTTSNSIVASRISIEIVGELVSNSKLSRTYSTSFWVRSYD